MRYQFSHHLAVMTNDKLKAELMIPTEDIVRNSVKHILSIIFFLSIVLSGCRGAEERQLSDYVNPFLGTATLWEPEDLGYVRTWKERTWGAEVFPGSSLPNAMVQLSPVTQFRSGAGYQYEDTVIYEIGRAHV